MRRIRDVTRLCPAKRLHNVGASQFFRKFICIYELGSAGGDQWRISLFEFGSCAAFCCLQLQHDSGQLLFGRYSLLANINDVLVPTLLERILSSTNTLENSHFVWIFLLTRSTICTMWMKRFESAGEVWNSRMTAQVECVVASRIRVNAFSLTYWILRIEMRIVLWILIGPVNMDSSFVIVPILLRFIVARHDHDRG